MTTGIWRTVCGAATVIAVYAAPAMAQDGTQAATPASPDTEARRFLPGTPDYDAQRVRAMEEAMRAGEAGEDAVAARHLTIACERGDIEGCNLLASALVSGTGVARDMPRAVALFRQGCDAGWAETCTALVEIHGITQPDGAAPLVSRADAITYARRAAALVPENADYGQSLRWLEAGAEPGVTVDPDSGLTAAQMMIVADGASRDGIAAATTASVYHRACDMGHLPACYELGVMYITQGRGANAVAGPETRYNALGTDPDYVMAMPLFTRACDGDVINACTLLDRLRRDGRMASPQASTTGR